jgi:hypothetical protein
MRRDVDVAQLHDEVGGIEASVAAKCDRFGLSARGSIISSAASRSA